MPRLPVSGSENTENTEDAARLTVKVGWAAFFVLAGLGLVWFFGIGLLDDWLGGDTRCSGERYYTRQTRIAEGVLCALEAGPRGWALLGWAAWWPLLIMWSLRRGLKKALARRGKRGR